MNILIIFMYLSKHKHIFIYYMYVFMQVFDEVDLSCRIETKELYALEGKNALLTDVSGMCKHVFTVTDIYTYIYSYIYP
jgi:hypothetical protein